MKKLLKTTENLTENNKIFMRPIILYICLILEFWQVDRVRNISSFHVSDRCIHHSKDIKNNRKLIRIQQKIYENHIITETGEDMTVLLDFFVKVINKPFLGLKGKDVKKASGGSVGEVYETRN